MTSFINVIVHFLSDLLSVSCLVPDSVGMSEVEGEFALDAMTPTPK